MTIDRRTLLAMGPLSAAAIASAAFARGMPAADRLSIRPLTQKDLNMTIEYPAANTALLIVDPYNDFATPGGKLYDAIKDTAAASGMFDNFRKLLPKVRSQGIQVFIVPHHHWHEGNYEHWQQLTALQDASNKGKVFETGSWGGEFNPEFGPQKGDVIVTEHWAQSGFANTDLDMQLKQHAIRKIVLVGFVANTCIESTGRYGMELGYHVTLIKDATAAFSAEGMHAAHVVNGPTFAHAILTTDEFVTKLG